VGRHAPERWVVMTQCAQWRVQSFTTATTLPSMNASAQSTDISENGMMPSVETRAARARAPTAMPCSSAEIERSALLPPNDKIPLKVTTICEPRNQMVQG